MAAVVAFLAMAVFSHSSDLKEKEKSSEGCIRAIMTLSAVPYKSHSTSVHFTSNCISAVTFHMFSPSLESTNRLQTAHEFAVLSLREMVSSLKGNFSILFSV